MVDELLVGFWQRRTKDQRSQTPYTATVSVTRAGPAWTLDISPDSPLTQRLGPRPHFPVGAGTVSAPATDLYLARWNRGATVDDPTGLFDTWREGGAITW